jgi:hypothetical protein
MKRFLLVLAVAGSLWTAGAAPVAAQAVEVSCDTEDLILQVTPPVYGTYLSCSAETASAENRPAANLSVLPILGQVIGDKLSTWTLLDLGLKGSFLERVGNLVNGLLGTDIDLFK